MEPTVLVALIGLLSTGSAFLAGRNKHIVRSYEGLITHLDEQYTKIIVRLNDQVDRLFAKVKDLERRVDDLMSRLTSAG